MNLRPAVVPAARMLEPRRQVSRMAARGPPNTARGGGRMMVRNQPTVNRTCFSSQHQSKNEGGNKTEVVLEMNFTKSETKTFGSEGRVKNIRI